MCRFHVIEAVDDTDNPTLFLAGSISNADNWQAKAIELLRDANVCVSIFNPRRKEFDISNPEESVIQIYWEQCHMSRADIILFYFSHETVAPITLYELGKWLPAEKHVFIGIHPDYPRKLDLQVQIPLVREDIKIVYSLEDVIQQVVDLLSHSELDWNERILESKVNILK